MANPFGVGPFPSYGHCFAYGSNIPQHHGSSEEVDRLMGRSLSPPPLNSSVLYIPYHTNRSAHTPVYDITESYHSNLGDLPTGGSKYKVMLCLMQKPTSNTTDVEVKYLSWFKDKEPSILLEERRLGGDGQQAQVTLSGHGFSIRTHDLNIYTSPTLTPSRQTAKGLEMISHYALSSSDEKIDLSWQMQPVQHGVLRYTLVDSFTKQTRAIYHHAGLECDIPLNYSEGVLILPDDRNPRLDAVVVSSLLGILWEVRNARVHQKKSFWGKFRGNRA